jgi:hypothetical protein
VRDHQLLMLRLRFSDRTPQDDMRQKQSSASCCQITVELGGEMDVVLMPRSGTISKLIRPDDNGLCLVCQARFDVSSGSWLFSNSGVGVKLSMLHLPGSLFSPQ